MAQLVERLVRNEEASGSNPLSSTKKRNCFGSFLFLCQIRKDLTIIRGVAELSFLYKRISFLFLRICHYNSLRSNDNNL